MKLSPIKALAVGLLFQVSAGCETSTPSGSPHTQPTTAPAEMSDSMSYTRLPRHWPLYGIGFYNGTDGVLENVRLEFVVGNRSYRSTAGHFTVHAEKENRGGPTPIPAEGTAFWTTPDGTEHSQHVALTTDIKNQWWFDGTIWLKITANGVVVEPVTDAESWERARNQLPMVQ